LTQVVLGLVMAIVGGWWQLTSASGQSLQLLNTGSVSNGAFSITWSYINSGFVLQKSSNLTATNWEASSLSALFNSNNATFSISTAATNQAEFFRLIQPVDLRGIYIYSGDVSSLAAGDTQTLSDALLVPGVDGLVLVIAWSALEPTNHVFHWTNLDFWMHQSIALGKKVDLAIEAGVDTPSWLFDPVTKGGAGAIGLNFTVSPHQGALSNCIPEMITAPWDTNFLASWDNMLRVLANHLKSVGTYSNVTLVRLTGINRTTDELRLPSETAQETGLSCVSNAPAIWQSVGYTPSNLLSGWTGIMSSFEKYFPEKTFCVAIIPKNAFPPIDDHGQVITKDIPDPNLPLLAYASQSLPGRLVVQFNSLVTGTNAIAAVPESAQSFGTLAAYQSNDWLGRSNGGAACGGDASNPVPCNNDADYLSELNEGIYPLTPTNSLRSQYIEVFPANVIAYTNAIWQAHAELFAPE
jgi:hypothetical protein